jgi:hypothetical protein
MVLTYASDGKQVKGGELWDAVRLGVTIRHEAVRYMRPS